MQSDENQKGIFYKTVSGHICLFTLTPIIAVHSEHVEWPPKRLDMVLKVKYKSLTWYSREDMMLMSKCFHRAPTSSTSSHCFKLSSLMVNTFSLLSAALIRQSVVLLDSVGCECNNCKHEKYYGVIKRT